jgi:hypothetical protein
MILPTLIVTADPIPKINPEYSAPFFKGLQQVASWVLGAGLVIAFILFVLAVLALAFKGISSAQMRSTAGAALPWVILGLIVLGGINGIFAWIVGFDFGFGTTFGGQG